MMTKKEIEKIREKLEAERKHIVISLEKISQRDKKMKGDWDTRYPEFQSGASGSQLLEEAADEVEEYVNLLPVEYNLELRLKDIDKALDKIKKNKYGRCEQCDKSIEGERLKAYPAAKLCAKCQKIAKK